MAMSGTARPLVFAGTTPSWYHGRRKTRLKPPPAPTWNAPGLAHDLPFVSSE